jgi:NDP-sugar pyrophosphorylase family protein
LTTGIGNGAPAMAVILAGGKGTRLKPFTMSIPKPLLPLGDSPILEIVLRQLAQAGVKRVVLTLGHMAHLFSAVIGDGQRFGLDVQYYTEDQPLGTAGSLRLIANPASDMLIMNGDILTTLDYAALLRHHRESRAQATIAMHKRSVHIDYGVIEQDTQGNLDRYIEKPVIDYKVSMGINIVSAGSLALIPADRKFDMPDLMLAIKASGGRVACYSTDCYWQDIGRFDDFEQASADYAADPARFVSPHSRQA